MTQQRISRGDLLRSCSIAALWGPLRFRSRLSRDRAAGTQSRLTQNGLDFECPGRSQPSNYGLVGLAPGSTALRPPEHHEPGDAAAEVVLGHALLREIGELARGALTAWGLPSRWGDAERVLRGSTQNCISGTERRHGGLVPRPR
jgi:hypothetical protein